MDTLVQIDWQTICALGIVGWASLFILKRTMFQSRKWADGQQKSGCDTCHRCPINGSTRLYDLKHNSPTSLVHHDQLTPRGQ